MQGELELLRVFRAAAESRSFREAAVRLGLSPQGVTRAIKRLEQHFGELLFHRNTRQMRITAFGEELLGRAVPTLDQIDALWQPAAAGVAAELDGQVRITAPRSLGLPVVMPALRRLATLHPRISPDVRLSDRIADTVDEGIDIGIRVGFMRDSRFVARRAGDLRLVIVGTPALIARAGLPESIDDLAQRPVVAATDINTGRPWPWYFKAGRQWTPPHPVMRSNDSELEMGAVLAGVGFGQLADYMAGPAIDDGRLQPVLQHYAPPAWGIHVYRPQRGPVSARVRVVFDELLLAVQQVTRQRPSAV
ncbi:MAG TPA: LysR family transcriptional regulator [Rhodanobacter sp.]